MIRRTYQCPDCEKIFTIECESNDPDPPCPNPACDKVLEWRPQRMTIGGSIESKAVDYTQQVLEQDYGLSNFKDNTREGDTSIIMRQETKVESEKVEREMHEQFAAIKTDPDKVAQFWGNNTGAPTTLNSVSGQQMIQIAKVGPQGPDPMSLLHQGIKKGNIPSTKQMTKVMAAADMQNPARKVKGS